MFFRPQQKLPRTYGEVARAEMICSSLPLLMNWKTARRAQEERADHEETHGSQRAGYRGSGWDQGGGGGRKHG